MNPYKKNIADSFSRSAARYDKAANVQQQSGKKMLSVMNQVIGCQTFNLGKKITIADIGCGTGFFTRQLNETYQSEKYIGVDIAEGMLAVAKENNADCTNVEWLRCEAEDLLLEDNSVDIIFSNFSLQWCDDLSALMKSFYRVLTPNGFCCFTSLGSNTLIELRQAWATVDQLPHVNPCHRRSQWQAAIVNNDFVVINHFHETVTEYFDSVIDAMQGLKEVGANVITAEHRQGLTGKQRFNQLIQAYEKYRTTQGIPASYDVDGWIIQKKGKT
ncbi:MAG: malonyl-CoA O-methyltransferase [Candidatus Endobugula sp.]|jgi:malonyl-CoA O-methyltransferase